MNICENGGICFFLILNYVNSLVNLVLFNNFYIEIINGLVIVECKCIKEWIGLWCKIDVDECLIKDMCNGYGFCFNDLGNYICFCEYGWGGL